MDEVGYMSYGQGYADLLFQVVSQRYQRLSTIVTTNRIFREWQEVFPSATSIVAPASSEGDRGGSGFATRAPGGSAGRVAFDGFLVPVGFGVDGEDLGVASPAFYAADFRR